MRPYATEHWPAVTATWTPNGKQLTYREPHDQCRQVGQGGSGAGQQRGDTAGARQPAQRRSQPGRARPQQLPDSVAGQKQDASEHQLRVAQQALAGLPLPEVVPDVVPRRRPEHGQLPADLLTVSPLGLQSLEGGEGGSRDAVNAEDDEEPPVFLELPGHCVLQFAGQPVHPALLCLGLRHGVIRGPSPVQRMHQTTENI